MSDSAWKAFNERRAYLIDKELTGGLDQEETAELKGLQAAADRYLDAVSPLRLEDLGWLEKRVKELEAERTKVGLEPERGE